ncbi:hypothetical protein [Pollutimonas bauzanensis]|uniref:Uncharacterized protein n=1 Tax=Pollutimonas bauzanensis TaxID=658167 RepID=A0A1M5ZMG4_9BURK|nr:hypothetical protein [Pollutimonas bauzanensis]SHI25364.1 hypothetical protein SAMN04488135_11627 [Pollutimonas bauzanensis]
MNSIRPDLPARRAASPLPQHDIAHEVGAVLRALIVIFAILLIAVLACAAIEPFADWTRHNAFWISGA